MLQTTSSAGGPGRRTKGCEHALDLGEEVRQFALEVRMHLACIDKTQELFTDQIFERAEKPEALPYVSSGVALRNPSPMKVSI